LLKMTERSEANGAKHNVASNYPKFFFDAMIRFAFLASLCYIILTD
jgi:hypothetical protein